MPGEELDAARKECDCWDSEDGCSLDYPEECKVAEACKKDAEGSSEEPVTA